MSDIFRHFPDPVCEISGRPIDNVYVNSSRSMSNFHNLYIKFSFTHCRSMFFLNCFHNSLQYNNRHNFSSLHGLHFNCMNLCGTRHRFYTQIVKLLVILLIVKPLVILLIVKLLVILLIVKLPVILMIVKLLVILLIVKLLVILLQVVKLLVILLLVKLLVILQIVKLLVILLQIVKLPVILLIVKLLDDSKTASKTAR